MGFNSAFKGLIQAVREGGNRIHSTVELTHIKKVNDVKKSLEFACIIENVEVTCLLLEENVHAGKAAMHIFVAGRFRILDLLHRYVREGDNKLKADNGEYLLHVACESGQVATVQKLSEHDALLYL